MHLVSELPSSEVEVVSSELSFELESSEVVSSEVESSLLAMVPPLFCRQARRGIPHALNRLLTGGSSSEYRNKLVAGNTRLHFDTHCANLT